MPEDDPRTEEQSRVWSEDSDAPDYRRPQTPAVADGILVDAAARDRKLQGVRQTDDERAAGVPGKPSHGDRKKMNADTAVIWNGQSNGVNAPSCRESEAAGHFDSANGKRNGLLRSSL